MILFFCFFFFFFFDFIERAFHKIRIKLHIDNVDSVPAELVIQLLHICEEACQQTHEELLREGMAARGKGGEQVEREANETLRYYRSDAVRVVAIENGSVVIEMLVLPLAYYILSRVIGDPIEKYIKQTEAYKRWQEYLIRNLQRCFESTPPSNTSKRRQDQLPLSLLHVDRQRIADVKVEATSEEYTNMTITVTVTMDGPVKE